MRIKSAGEGPIAPRSEQERSGCEMNSMVRAGVVGYLAASG